MSKNTDDTDDETDTSERDEVDLKYSVYTDTPSLSVYLKFSGFSEEKELDEFVEYIESYIPLIFLGTGTKH